MATQFMSLAGLRLHTNKNITRTSSYALKRSKKLRIHQDNPISCNQNHIHHVISSSELPGGDEKETKPEINGRRNNRQARKLPRFLVLWFMSSSLSYILRRARAFYNEFCCDAYNDAVVTGFDTTVSTDPYFAVPVIPPPIIASNYYVV